MNERETWTLEYDDGAVYTGELDENDVPNGHGEKVWPDGEKYVGQWKDNNFNGQGVYHYADGSVYKGNWKDSIRNGYGKYTCEDGSIYEGEWKDDMSHGKGKMTYDDGAVYEGDWKEDERHGYGVLHSADGGVYEGNWKADMWHGYGVFRGSDGSIYEGEWKEDMWHGKGKMTYPDGDIYEGEWKEDMWHGKGKLSHPDGSFYDGEWFEDEMHGYARFTLDDGSIAEGYWEHDELVELVHNGKSDGFDDVIKGLEAYLNGKDEEEPEDFDEEWEDEDAEAFSEQEGNCRDEQEAVLNGYHAYTYYDGSVYEGGWENGKRHGRGTLRKANGDTYEGSWEADKKQGYGIYRYTDNYSYRSYEGQWVNDEWCGYGKLTRKGGVVEEGGWKNGWHHGVVKEVRASGCIKICLYTEGSANGLEYKYDPSLKAESERRSAALWKQGDLIDRSGSYYCAGKDWKVLKTNGQYEYAGEIGQSGKVRYPYGLGELYWISGESKGDKAAGKFNSSSELVSGFYIDSIMVVKYGKFKDWRLEGYGRQLFEDGCYEGNFLGGRYHGEGIWYSNNGTTYMGIFEHNKLKRLTKIIYPSGLEVTDPVMLMACNCPYSYMSPSDE